MSSRFEPARKRRRRPQPVPVEEVVLAAAPGTRQAVTGAMQSALFERTRGERSSQSYRKIRIAKPEVVDRVAQALPALLQNFRILSTSGDRLPVVGSSSRGRAQLTS
jgi:hypothetical protein